MRLYTCFHWKHVKETHPQKSLCLHMPAIKKNSKLLGKLPQLFPSSPWGHPTSSKRGKLGCWTSLIALAVETWNLKLSTEGHSTPFFDILSNFRRFGILDCYFFNVNSGLQVAYLHKVFVTAFWTPELSKVLQINSDRCFRRKRLATPHEVGRIFINLQSLAKLPAKY